MEWLWKGTSKTPTAEVNTTIYYPEGTMPLEIGGHITYFFLQALNSSAS